MLEGKVEVEFMGIYAQIGHQGVCGCRVGGGEAIKSSDFVLDKPKRFC